MLKHELFTSAKRTFVRSTIMVAALAMTVSLSACNKDMSGPGGTDNNNPVVTDPSKAIPTSPGAMTASLDNPLGNTARIELGRHLFYDGRISIADKSITDDPNNRAPGISCGSCHNPAQGFSDPRLATSKIPFSEGVQGKIGTRNAPGLTNVGYNTSFTWDGKFASLEKHVPGPMFSQVEMGNNLSTSGREGEDDGYDHTPGPNDTLLLFQRIQGDTKYADLFIDAYGESSISLDRIVKAIAAFERTFVSVNSPFDEYNKFLHNQGGSETAISESAKRGFKLFIDPMKANCISCHSGYNFSDSKLHNNGLLANDKDPGAAGVPGKNNSNNTLFNFFKVPTLRNVALSAPYMHNGSLATLSDVVMHYNSGGHDNSKREIKPLGLTAEEQADLVAFLESLTDQNFATNTAFNNPWIKK